MKEVKKTLARKFNKGRQSEYLMNEQLFNAYSSIKYVNHVGSVPQRDKQAEIVHGALWTDTSSNSLVLKRYDSKDDYWHPMFEGYYQPICSTIQPENPADGQIWIDPNGIIKYWDSLTKQWKIPYALQSNGIENTTLASNQFLIMPDMKALTNTEDDYCVPDNNVGKLFNGSYFVRFEDYIRHINEPIRITYGKEIPNVTLPVKKPCSIITEDNKEIIDNNGFIIASENLTYDVLETFGLSHLVTESMSYILTESGKKILLEESPDIQDSPTMEKGVLSWVHANPYFLSDCKKRLIKIPKSGTNAYKIETNTVNTEFYGFYSGDPNGHFLRCIKHNEENSHYRLTSKGIELLNTAMHYDYIYAITYIFSDIDTTTGNLIRGSVEIGEVNQVYIGQVAGYPLVFLDGTFQEQDRYEYDFKNGTLTFSGEEIENEMDLVVASFANILTEPTSSKPYLLTITNKDIIDRNIVIRDAYAAATVKQFKHPMVFVNGIGALFDSDYVAFDEVEINGDVITIFNFGEIAYFDNAVTKEWYITDETNDYPFVTEDGKKIITEIKMNTATVNVMIADIGDAYLDNGYVKNNEIISEHIKGDGTYLLFINGICISPKDYDVSEGRISVYGDLKNQQYVLLSLDKGMTGIELLYDNPVSYFTTRIENKNSNAVYDDCSMAVCYVADEDYEFNGILIDDNFIKTTIDKNESYTTGQILNVLTIDENGGSKYEYMIYNHDGKQKWTKLLDAVGNLEYQDVINMATQFSNSGSISIKKNKDLIGKDLYYYAYTYANEIDEPIQVGKRNCIVNIPGHETQKEMQDFYTNRTQPFYAGKGCVSTFINGVQTPPVKDYIAAQCKFTVETPTGNSFNKEWGTKDHDSNRPDLYKLLKAIDESTTIYDLQEMKEEGEYSYELRDYYVNEDLLADLKTLSNSIKDSEAGEELLYMIENTEETEDYSCDRITMTVLDRYDNFNNTYKLPNGRYLGAGNISVYLNGVYIERQQYTIFDNNKIILNEINTIGGNSSFDINDPSTHNIFKYFDKKEGVVKDIVCSEADELMIEYRPDTSIKRATYNIKEVSYDTQAFDIEDYEYPVSLKNTKDHIKIYINGLLYSGKYTNRGGVITLLDAPLMKNPLEDYKKTDEYAAWESEHGKYTYEKDRITFEWR